MGSDKGRPFPKVIFVDLRADRSALVFNLANSLEGRWSLKEGQVTLSGRKELASLQLRRFDGATTINLGTTPDDVFPARRIERGPDLVAAELDGEWSVDVDATVAASRALWAGFSDIWPGDKQEAVEQMIASLHDQLKTDAGSFKFEGGKVTLTYSGKTGMPVSYSISGDMVLFKVSGGLKSGSDSDPGQDFNVAMFARGKALQMDTGIVSVVFTKNQPKKDESAKPSEPVTPK